jgi:hypothetical protein
MLRRAASFCFNVFAADVQLEYQPAGKGERQPASLLNDTGGDSVKEALAFGEPLKDARRAILQ